MMLPAANSTEKDITISAHFICDGDVDNGKNYGLKGYPRIITEFNIDSLKIEVTSIDHNCDIGIDFLRIETRPARELYRGVWDSILVRKIQMDLDTITHDTVFTNKGLKPYRWYLVDEPGWEVSFYWGAHHYLRKLCGAVFTHEVWPLPPHYRHYVNYHEKWNGMRSILTWRRAPWLPGIQHYYKGLEQWKYWGISDGFDESELAMTPEQKDNFLATSGYETVFRRPDNGYWVTEDGVYIPHSDDYLRNISTFEKLRIEPGSYTSYSRGLLLNIDGADHQYINKALNGFLYDTCNWWGQINLDGRFKRDSGVVWIYKDYDGYRQLTGEEVRLFSNNFILYGAKGISVDGEQTYYDWGYGAMNLHSGQDSVNSWGMNNLPALEFLMKDSIGGDFVNFTGSTDPLRNLVLGDSVSYYCGVPINRIYTGRKSSRLELFKTYTFVRRCEKELMNMQFQAAICKGYRNFYTQHPKYGSPKIMDKFLDATKIIHTRPLGRSRKNPTTGEDEPYYENDFFDPYNEIRADSGFYHITLLSDKADPNMTSSFYLGVQNKRVGPHIYDPGPTKLTDRIKFYSSAEIDELYLRNRDSGAAINWARLGCREVRIPIKYTKSTLADEYTTLRISEVGINDTLLQSYYWRQKDYCHVIDTSFGREGELVLRLLPGEGKLLKVEICNTTYELSGNLDRSNQRKIVAYPNQYHQTLDTSYHNNFPVRYHAVYYKNNIGNPPRSKVYYKHSIETPRAFPNESIIWHYLEIPLFDSVRVFNTCTNLWDTLINPECKYPAIVVRYDPASFRQKAYIVAACTDSVYTTHDTCYGDNFIVEAVLQDIETATPRLTKMPEAIARVSAARDRKITDFAIPTINASAEGNFYAWADSLAGIRVGFKRPHETQFAPNNIISFRWFSGYNTRAVDPSLNTYSKIRWGENDCSVAWAEIDPLPSSDTVSDIYYTQVYWDGAALRRELPRKNAYIFWASYNSDKTMILLSKKYNMPNPEYQTRQNRFPVIYRAIDENTDLCPGCPPQMQTLERVYWQGKDIQYDEGNPRRAVFYVAIDQYDSLYNNKWYPNAWSVQTLYDIMSPSKSLYFPDAAQGRLVGRKANNDSAMHLNFVALADSSNPEIWHISHGWWSMMSVNDFPTLMNDFEDYKYARKVGPGVYPHLAAFPYVYDESYRWYNRRIFNNTFPNSTAKALSSVKWVFNKEGIDEEPDEKFYAFFGYRKDSTLRIIHSQPMLNRSGRSHKIAFSKEIDVKTLSTRDTLYSDWFEIDDIAIMEFIQAYKSDKKSKYFIENQKGQKIEIGKIPMPSKAFNKRKIALTKGGGKAYRALWVKPEGAQYFEEGVIGNFESAAETMEGLNKSGMDELNEIEFVNLSAGQSNYENTLEIYPNPAESELYFNSNSLAVVEVYDLMGKCQMRFLDLKEPKIEVGALPAGVYILKVGVLQQKFIKY